MPELIEDRQAWHENFTDNWLAHFQQTGETNWKLYNRVRNRETISGPAVDLTQSKLVFITSSGAYLHASQEAYDAEDDLGDYSIRTFPTASPLNALAFAHTHYDHTAVDADAQALVPLRHLEALRDEGIIGSLAEETIAFMGYQPDATRTVEETVPAIVAAARKQNAHAALLVPS
jgi:hypothetical protein